MSAQRELAVLLMCMALGGVLWILLDWDAPRSPVGSLIGWSMYWAYCFGKWVER